MNNKHTPGPWYASRIPDQCAYNVFAASSNLALVTVLPNGDTTEQTLAVPADARLISAAPDMLIALQKAVRFGGLDSDLQAVCEAAIAKATRVTV